MKRFAEIDDFCPDFDLGIRLSEAIWAYRQVKKKFAQNLANAKRHESWTKTLLRRASDPNRRRLKDSFKQASSYDVMCLALVGLESWSKPDIEQLKCAASAELERLQARDERPGLRRLDHARKVFLNHIALIYWDGTGKPPIIYRHKNTTTGPYSRFATDCCGLVGIKPGRVIETSAKFVREQRAKKTKK